MTRRRAAAGGPPILLRRRKQTRVPATINDMMGGSRRGAPGAPRNPNIDTPMKANLKLLGMAAAVAAGASIVAAAPPPAAGPRKPLDLPVDQRPIERAAAPAVTSYAPMLERVTPSVVAVYTAEVVRVVRGQGSPYDDFMRRFFGLPEPRRQGPAEPEIEEQRIPQGMGSGVIVAADGHIVTNNHVVSDQRGGEADEVLVRLNDGRELPARILGRDPRTDIAVLKVDADGLPAVRLADSDACKVGDIVFAIGNPMGVGLTVTKGIISATRRAIGIYGREGYEDFIQTDASINPGNSGGALVDIEGRLIGVNSAILSRTGGNIGIGFAIPGNLVANVSRQLSEFGEVRRGILGIQVSEVTPDMAEAFKLDRTEGVLVDHVEQGTPAAAAGLQRGDIITAINGKPAGGANGLRLRIAQTTPGAKIHLSVLREGKPLEVDATVGDQAQQLGGPGGDLLEGVEVAVLDDELREQYGVPDQVGGLVVTGVAPDSPFVRHLREGMVVIEVNDRPVEQPDDARAGLREGVNKFYVWDRGRVGYLALRVRR